MTVNRKRNANITGKMLNLAPDKRNEIITTQDTGFQP